MLDDLAEEGDYDPIEGRDASPLCRRAAPHPPPSPRVSPSASSTSTTISFGASPSAPESLHLLSFPDEILMRVLSHLEGSEVEQVVGHTCKRLLRLSKDDYLWYLMTKRVVKRERAERWRQQARERRDALLKRRLSCGVGGGATSGGSKCMRMDEGSADQEAERMEMEDKPEASLEHSDALMVGEHAPTEAKVGAVLAGEKDIVIEEDDDGNADGGDFEGAEAEDYDYEGEDERDGPARAGTTASPSGVRRGTSPAATLAERRRRKMKQKAKKQPYDLRKPPSRDWKWVYQCKTTILEQPHTDKVTGVGRYRWTGGSYYEGEWRDGKPEGLGTKVWGENEFYEGEWKNGKMHFGVYKWPDGAYYEGQWREGLHEGFGVYHWADGNKYEGFWKVGQRDGYGVRTWPDGDVFEGDWVAGKRTGKGVYCWPNGSRYEGEWKNGCHHGYGVYQWLDGRRYEGQWDCNKKHGVGTYHFDPSEGCAYSGHWVDGYRHGYGVMTWSHGALKYVGQWVRDQRALGQGHFVGPDSRPLPNGSAEDRPQPYDLYFVEEESAWEAKYRAAINRKRIEALQRLKAHGKLPYPIREDKVLDPEG